VLSKSIQSGLQLGGPTGRVQQVLSLATGELLPHHMPMAFLNKAMGEAAKFWSQQMLVHN
jgi:hypothetical protein